jgi:hypothetical protein
MIISDTPCPQTIRKELATTFLRLHGTDAQHRNYYVQLGYKYGLTSDEIRDAVNHGTH